MTSSSVRFVSRYRVSPDCVPLSNGRKNSLRTCKEDDADSGGRIPNYSPFEGKPPRRSGSGSTALQDHHFPHVPFPSDSSQSENQPPYAAADSTPPVAKAPSHHHEINGVSRGSGDVLLQWGHKKRSRGSRAESRAAAGNDSVHSRQMIKIQRRSAAAGSEKLAAAAAASAAMPPPCGSYTRGANLRPCLPTRDTMTSSFNRGERTDAAFVLGAWSHESSFVSLAFNLSDFFLFLIRGFSFLFYFSNSSCFRCLKRYIWYICKLRYLHIWA